MTHAYLSREQREKLLLDAGWKPWACWIDPLKKTMVCEEVAMKEQQERNDGKPVVISWANRPEEAVMTAVIVDCPRCGHPLSPVLKGAYSHFPDTRFCEKCIRFVEAAGADAKASCRVEGCKP